LALAGLDDDGGLFEQSFLGGVDPVAAGLAQPDSLESPFPPQFFRLSATDQVQKPLIGLLNGSTSFCASTR
jgi:hypothetical protein